MVVIVIIGGILLYQAIRHDGRRLLDDVMYLIALPAVLIGWAGDAAMRWWAKRDKWGM